MDTKKKMISLVDLDLFKSGVNLTVENPNAEVKDKYIMEYLERWADAKKEIFEMFGEKLSIKKTIATEMDTETMDSDIRKLCSTYPQYAATIMELKSGEYIKNVISSTEGRLFEALFPKDFKEGAKTSRVLSKIICDSAFDVDLSRILQGRATNGTVAISIDPMDFITMSTNDRFKSCMTLVDGWHRAGVYSPMLDKSSIIGFVGNGRKITHKNAGGSLEYEDHLFRQIILLDKNRTSFALGHKGGLVSDLAKNEWVSMMKKCMGVENLREKDRCGYCEKGGVFYYDTRFEGEYTNTTEEKQYSIGVKSMPCLCCGKELSRQMEYKDFLICKGGHSK